MGRATKNGAQLANLSRYNPLRTKIRCALAQSLHEIGVLDRYLTTKNPSRPDVTTTIPDLKKG